MWRFDHVTGCVLAWTAVLLSVASHPCSADDEGTPTFDGVWRADVPAGSSFYQNGWALARFGKNGAFSMAIVHQRDRGPVERLHLYSGKWARTTSGAAAKSLTFMVGQDRFRSERWTFTLSDGKLTDDRNRFTWRRYNPGGDKGSIAPATLVGRWNGVNAAGQPLSLALEPNGEARLRGDRISLSFQRGGGPNFAATHRDGEFFQIAGRWSIFHDTVVLYDTAYTASTLGNGQYAPALFLKRDKRAELQLHGVTSKVAILKKDDRLPAARQGESLPPAKRSAHEQIAHQADTAALSMLYHGNTAKECRAWQQRFRDKLQDLLGISSPPEKWAVEQQSRREFDGYARLELLLHADGVPSLPVYLLIPHSASAEHPSAGVLCIHGHGPFGNDAVVGRRHIEGVAENIAKHNYDYAVQFTRRGYVVAAPCMTPFGRRVDADLHRRTDPCAAAFVRMQALGKLLITENLRDLRWALSLLEGRQEVSAHRLGSAGLSYGGRMCMMVTAVDPRIKVACISGAWHLLQERVRERAYTCGGQIIPGILQYGDYPEIASLIAPRPCVWEIGSQDRGVNRTAGAQVTERLQRAYRSLNAADQLHFDHFEGGHEWSGRVAFPVFDAVLKE